MMIHPTAIIDPSAEIHESVEIGPFVVIGKNVKIGEGTKIESSVRIHDNVEIGKNNFIDHSAAIGGMPQSVGFDPKLVSGVKIGDNNLIREFVTIHRASKENENTIIKNNRIDFSKNFIFLPININVLEIIERMLSNVRIC